MVRTPLSRIAEMMQWGSVPLLVVMGLWENSLSLMETDHKLVRILLLMAIFGWVIVWNRIEQVDGLIHYTCRVSQEAVEVQKATIFIPDCETSPVPHYSFQNHDVDKTISIASGESYHGSDN